jgi:alanine-synthesizing transaminase
MSYRFSQRTGWDTGESAFARAIREAHTAGRRLVDLTVSNPTACGFEYDADVVLGSLNDARGLVYDPDPRGMRSAREAVAAYYGDHRAVVDPDALILTTSTSEGYGYLFRLLCDAGDEVLVAQPSYPLFDFLADLEDVRLRPYPLFYDYGWWIDFAELERCIGPHTRAIVVVHPNNPTGHATKTVERAKLEEICQRHSLALIVDEVFLDYPVEAGTRVDSFSAGQHSVLTFVLSGMSKIAGLPQMKAGWILALGPEKARQAALGRLEMIADTFLSMNAPVQLSLPHWLSTRQRIQSQILARVRQNLAAATAGGVDVLKLEAGWSAILRLPWLEDGDALAMRLLQESGAVVHSGSFYGIAGGGRVVVSLITQPATFSEGMRLIRANQDSY